MENYLKTELYDLIKQDPAIFDFIQKGSLDGIWYWDLENPENEWMSEKLWTELGYDPQLMPHKVSAWHDIIFKDDLEVAINNFNKHLEDPKHPYDQIVRYRHSDGSTVHIRCRGIIIRDEDGKALRMLGAHNNITQVMEKTRELKELNQQLVKKNKELEQFAYITSHDLQEPLNSILSFVSLLQKNIEGNFSETELQYLKIIELSSHRMKDFIWSLLEFSRIGRVQEKSDALIKDMIATITLDLTDLISREEAVIQYEGEDFIVNGIQTDLLKLFQNLIVNGIKFKRSEVIPHIRIQGKEATDSYEFSVSDNGIGIAEESFDKIFEVFQRLHPRDQYEGTGIGLAYCKKIVDLHQGEIWLESKEGEGTTFYFSISK